MVTITRDDPSGVTLIELVISVAVFMILLLSLLALRPSQHNTEAAQRSAQLLVSDLRSLQNRSQSGVLFQGAQPNGGYGVWLDRTTLPSAAEYGLIAENGDHRYQSGDDPFLPAGEKTFGGSARFAELWINNQSSLDKTLLLTFSPGNADVIVTTDSQQALKKPDVCMLLRTKTGASWAVHVNGSSGQVETLSACL